MNAPRISSGPRVNPFNIAEGSTNGGVKRPADRKEVTAHCHGCDPALRASESRAMTARTRPLRSFEEAG